MPPKKGGEYWADRLICSGLSGSALRLPVRSCSLAGGRCFSALVATAASSCAARKGRPRIYRRSQLIERSVAWWPKALRHGPDGHQGQRPDGHLIGVKPRTERGTGRPLTGHRVRPLRSPSESEFSGEVPDLDGGQSPARLDSREPV